MVALPQDRELELIAAAQAGCNSAKSALIAQYDRFLWKCAIKGTPPGEDREDHYQIASIYFLQAIDRFDPSKNARLITHLYASVPRQMLRHKKHSGLIHVPASVHWKESRKFRQRIKSLDFRQDDGSRSFVEGMSDGSDFDEEILRRDDIELVRAAIEKLPDGDREIIKRRMAGETLKEIGDSFGITREWVRVKEGQAEKILRELITDRDSLYLPRKPRVHWTPEEISYLRRNHGKKSIAELTSALGRGATAIPPMIYKLGIAKPIFWTPQQDQFLRENAANGRAWIAEQLGKTESAVNNRARKIGIGRRHIDDVGLAILIQLQNSGLTPVAIGREMNVSDECIRYNLRKLGLKPNKRNETERLSKLKETLQERFGVSGIGGIRKVVGEKRAAELGCAGIPFTAALTLVAIQKIGRPAHKIEIAAERVKIAESRGWSVKLNKQVACGTARQTVRIVAGTTGGGLNRPPADDSSRGGLD